MDQPWCRPFLLVKPSFTASCFLTPEDPGSGAYKSTSLTRLVGRFPSFLAAVSFNTLLECYPKDTQLQSLVSSYILELIKSEIMNVFGLVGEPIFVNQVADPTSQEIDELHDKYLTALRQLYEKYNPIYGDPKVQLNYL